MGSLGKVPATGFLSSAFIEVESFFKKIVGDAAGAKRAMEEVGNLQKGLAESIAKGQEKIAAATKKSEKATADLAAATKYTKLKSSAQATSDKLGSLKPKLEKSSSEYAAAQRNVGRAKTEEAVAVAIQKESVALAKFNAMLKERDRLESKRGKMESGLGKAASGLESRGIKLDKQGMPNLGKLTDKASAAKANVQTVKDSAIAKQQEFKDKIAGTVDSLKSFAAMSVTSAAGVAVMGGAMIAAVGAALSLTSQMAAAADELNDQATAMGLTSSQLQNLRDTYLQLGVSAGAAEGQLQRLQISLSGGDEKTTGAAAAFRKLGLNMAELRKMTPDKALNATIGAIRTLGNQSEKMKALRDVFGRGGVGLAAAVNATNEELAIASKRASALALPDSMIEDLARIHDSTTMMGRAFDNIKTMFASAFGPVLENIADSLFEMMTTDTSSMLAGMQSIAVVLAVVYDLIAAVVNLFKMLWNVLQAIVGILASGLLYVIGAVLKVVQMIVYAVEWLLGASHKVSGAVGEAASMAFDTAKQMAKGAGTDAMEAFQSGIDAVKPDGTMAVLAQINKGYKNTADKINGESLEPSIDEQSIIKSSETLLKKMEELQEAARTVEMTPLQLQLEEVGRLALAAGADVGEMQKRAANYAMIVARGEMWKKQTDEMKSATDQLNMLTESAGDYAYNEAMAAGFGTQVAERMAKRAEELEITKKKIAATQELKSITQSLEQEAATAGMNEKEKLVYQLKLNGAKDEEVAAALKLKDLANSKTATGEALKGWQDLLGGLDKQLLEVNSSREDQLRKMAAAAGMLGKDIDAAVANALKLETSLTEAQKLKSAQESSKSTLKDLEDEVRRLTIGEKAFKREQFAKGADKDQMKQYDALTAASESLQTKDEAKASEVSAIGSIETAFGSFNFGLDVQKQILNSADQQTAVLQMIATNTGVLAGMKDGVSSGATSKAVIAGTDPQLAESNKLLTLIEMNTRGTLT